MNFSDDMDEQDRARIVKLVENLVVTPELLGVIEDLVRSRKRDMAEVERVHRQYHRKMGIMEDQYE